MAFYCNGKKGICDKISSSLSICPQGCEFADGTGGYDVAVPMPKPVTNADHIRSMSDEELIDIVPCPNIFSMFQCGKNIPCIDCKRDWLKQPYKEEKEE